MKGVGGVALYHESHGTGSPILFLHGLGTSTHSWRHLIQPLSKQHKLILVDLKGFGKSPKPRDNDYSIQDQAELIYQFILRNNLSQLTIVGHSLGGGVALLTAIKLSEQEPGRLASLILISSASYHQDLPLFIEILRRPFLGPLAFSLLTNKKKVRMILERAYYDDKKISKDQVQAYTTPLNSSGGENALIETAKKIIPSNIDEITAAYKNIRFPTLILWGRQDKIVPAKVGEKLHQALPNSQLVIIDRCGHIPHEEKPEEAINIISNFLQTSTNQAVFPRG
jgi:pimeloyl-ACP methyl ester carboxylesterase